MNVLTVFDDEEFAKVMHDDGYEEGFNEGIQKGLNEGIQKGLTQGSREATDRIIRNMLNNSVAIDVIIAATDCTEDYIINLKNS